MQILATIGVFFITLLIFLVGFVLGRRKGINECGALLTQCMEEIKESFDGLLSNIQAIEQKESEENGRKRDSEKLENEKRLLEEATGKLIDIRDRIASNKTPESH